MSEESDYKLYDDIDLKGLAQNKGDFINQKVVWDK